METSLVISLKFGWIFENLGRFFEMLAISMGVAIISFGMGYLVRLFVGVSV